MKSLVAPTKRQNYADGGVVGAIKGMFGIKPEDPERARRLAEYRANAAREKEAAKAATAPAPAPAPAITDYAAGSALKRREAAAGLKDGGPVRGPGTGTSDDVPDNVPEGTYIMPADSTRAIGEKTLGGLGMRGIDVNLSNGEFKLSPKQVHAIGVQALNQLKDATHTPSSTEAAKGMKPELFFEGGGVASEEERQRRISQIPVGGNMPAPPADGKNDTEFSRNVNNGLNALGGMGVVASTPLRAPAVAQELRGAYQTLTGPAAKAAAPAADFIAGAGPNATAYANTIPRLGNAPTPVLPGTNAALQQGAQANAMSGAVRAASGASAGATGLANTQPNDPTAAAPAAAPAPAPAPAAPSEYSRQMSAVGGALADGAAWLGKTIVSAPGYGLSRPSAAPAPAPAGATTTAGAGRGAINPAPVNPAQAVAAAPAPTNAPTNAPAAPTQQPTNEVMPGVYQHGRGQYSDNASGMGLTSVPGSGGQGSPVGKTVEQAQREGLVGERVGYNPAYDQRLNGATGISAQNMAAADALAGRSQQESMNRVTARGMGSLAQSVSAPTVPNSSNDWAARNNLRNMEVSASSITNQPGFSRGGRGYVPPAVAAYQAGLQTDAALQQAQPGMDQTAMRENAGIQREGMQQDGATTRTGIQEQGSNARAAVSSALQRDEFGLKKEAAEFQTRAAARLENLQTRYEAEKDPAKRSELAQQLRELQAKDAPARYKVAAGGQQIDANGVAYRTPDRIFNEQTGVFSDGAGAAPAPQALPPGMKRQIGTSNGRPVYEDMNGKQVIAKG